MSREKLTNHFKMAVIILGALCLGWALLTLSSEALSLSYFLVVIVSIALTPPINLTLPRSRFTITFSDALIFLCFLIYGGAAAILLATLEALANCFYTKWKGNINFGRYMIPTNTFIATISTSITYLVWSIFSHAVNIEHLTSDTRGLIFALGVLALTQFLASSVIAAVFQSIKDGANLWVIWKKECFSFSLTQIVGAGLAGLIYKLINFGDLAVAVIAFIGLGVVYLTYKQSIAEINQAIDQAEEAERKKAETERERRMDAEQHAFALSKSLEKEEQTSAALRKSRKDFKHAALHDSLTGLPNRKQLGDMLRSMIENYKKDPTKGFYVLFLDIRRFKNINDSLGHTLGDKVLMIAAKRFVRMLTPHDTVARLGGDEFAVILREVSTAGKAQKVARRICSSILQPFSLSGNRISISVNIGVAASDVEYDTPEEILRDADIAMHYAKEKNTGVAVFTKELRERFMERARFELDLRHAVERNELSMHYQPIVSLTDGNLIGFEALLRWQHSEVGFIPPVKFIPIAEESGLIMPITVWILHETCRQLKKWQQVSPAYENLIVSVNISGRHLSTDELLDDVEYALEYTKLAPRHLKLEITESTAMENAEHTINMLHSLKKIGVQLSIDDFGTGYSSLSYLHRLPFDTLKIDRSFVSRVGTNGENSEILQTIISLAKNLKMRVIAEGIETESQFSLLQNLGCDYGQGYLLAKPKPLEETEELLYQRPNWLPFGHEHHVVVASAADDNLPVF